MFYRPIVHKSEPIVYVRQSSSLNKNGSDRKTTSCLAYNLHCRFA